MEYSMHRSSRGRVIIINNVEFNAFHLDSRHSSIGDAEALKNALTVLGYAESDITVLTNLTALEMQTTLMTEAARDHTNEDSFMCVLLSHGYYDKVYFNHKMMWVDLIWGTDAPVALRLLTECFKTSKAPSLKGKPKVFIIQTCRGGAASCAVACCGGAASGAVVTERRNLYFQQGRSQSVGYPSDSKQCLQDKSRQYIRALSISDDHANAERDTAMVGSLRIAKPSSTLRDFSVLDMDDSCMETSNVSDLPPSTRHANYPSQVRSAPQALKVMETGEKSEACANYEGDMLEAGGERHTPGAPVDDYVENIHRDAPVFIDHLLYYATQPFHVAFINSRHGAFFVKTLVKQLEKHRGRDNIDFLQLLTKVNHDVAYNFISDVKDEDCKGYTGKKQMPRISSRLTKQLMFRRMTESNCGNAERFSAERQPPKRFCSDHADQ